MCGLVGFYPKKNKQVDLSKLYPLWVLNEERGTHSCGIAFGPNREVGVFNSSKARDLISSTHSKIIATNLVNQPIICHTRHATNGAHTEKNAHPFRWHRTTEDNFFMFAHNGVIRSLYDFKKTLGMHRHTESLMEIDSQVLGLAMYDAYTNLLTEKEILTQYEGNAAFLCYDSNNVFKAWKGANNEVEERPLYYVETKDGWYFCSIELSLSLVFLQKAIEVPDNTLITFSNNKLQSSVVYKRAIQAVTTAATASSKAFENLVGTSAKPTKYSSSLNVIDNVLKMSLKRLLEKEKSSDSTNKTDKKIEIENYGDFRGKYCVEAASRYPLSGTYLFSKDSENIGYVPKITNVGRALTFQNGVLIKHPGFSYYTLQQKFEELLDKKDKGFEEIFNILFDNVAGAIVDFIPLYYKKNLTMIIYNKDSKINYITNRDKVSIDLPNVFAFKTRAIPTSNHLYITSL